jgi:hypothetical protein
MTFSLNKRETSCPVGITRAWSCRGPNGSAAAKYVLTLVSRRPHQGPAVKRRALGGPVRTRRSSQ